MAVVAVGLGLARALLVVVARLDAAAAGLSERVVVALARVVGRRHALGRDGMVVVALARRRAVVVVFAIAGARVITIRARALVEVDVEVSGWASTIDTSDVCRAVEDLLKETGATVDDVVDWRELEDE